ncbi:MAG: hypothetical protein NTV81_02410 [Candidatus Komeilibacteria bacterium]|nr:hypothetical protein [Candidatus Komeilibacteria bacterium]
MADSTSFIDKIGFDVLLDLIMNFVFHKMFAKKIDKAGGSQEAKPNDTGASLGTKDDENILLVELRAIVADYKGGALAVGEDTQVEEAFVLKAWDDFAKYCIETKQRPEILVAIRKILKAEDNQEERRQTFGWIFGLLVKGDDQSPTAVNARFDRVIELVDSVNVSEFAQAKANVKAWVKKNRNALENAFHKFANPAWLKKELPKWRRFKAQLEQRANGLSNERRRLHRKDRMKTRAERVNELAGAAGNLILGRPTKWRFSLFDAIITIIAIAVAAVVVISMIN